MLNKKYKEDINARLSSQNIFSQALAQSVRELKEKVSNHTEDFAFLDTNIRKLSSRLDSLQIEMADLLVSKAVKEAELKKKIDEVSDQTDRRFGETWRDMNTLETKHRVNSYFQGYEFLKKKLEKLYKHFNLTEGLVETLTPITNQSDVNSKYCELLYAVARKFPGESRHETALRYIQEREQRASSGPDKLAY